MAEVGDHSTSVRLAPGYLVYVRANVGMQVQKWAELDFGERDHLRPSVVAVFELAPGEELLPLVELAKRYPLPVYGQVIRRAGAK